LHLVDDIAMVKNGCIIIDFGCNCVLVLQPHLLLLQLVVTITTDLLGCNSYNAYCNENFIAEANVVPNCTAISGLQLLQLIPTRTLWGEAKVVFNCNAFLVLQHLYDCNENTAGRSKSGPQLQFFC
jgi:hypothetical protein